MPLSMVDAGSWRITDIVIFETAFHSVGRITKCAGKFWELSKMEDQLHSFFDKNTFYKNIEAGICEIVRIF